jgi:hypothetical protein
MAVMINGEKTTLEARQEFLFQTQDGKTAFDPTEIAKGIPLETLLRGYQVDTPNRLVVNLKSLKIDYAPVKVGNGDETAPGLVITCSIEVEPPRDLQPGTRTVTVSFPATMVLKRLLGAATPEKTPHVTFTIRNYMDRSSLAADMWRWSLISIFFCLVVGGLVLALGIAMEHWVAIVGIGIGYAGGVAFLGILLEQLLWLNGAAALFALAILSVPIAIASAHVAIEECKIKWTTVPIAIAVVVALSCWQFLDCPYIAIGTAAFIPGLAIGAVAAAWSIHGR